MSETGARATLLIVASDPGIRHALSLSLEDRGPLTAVAPEALTERSRFVDAGAAIAVLESGGGAGVLEAMVALRSLPAGRALVLLTNGVFEDAVLQKAIRELQPLHVLAYPVSGPALCFALESALPAGVGREGARPSHRPAPALLGVSAAIREILEQIGQLARTRVPVLILGETGTGKELVARAIHQQSERGERAFVALNCGALPDSLLESELFGHERGAFTGAESRHPGLFEQADGGTLFLDEVGEMPPSLQVKLLRVLETGEVRAVGANRIRQVDVRIVSATHRELGEAVESGGFRQDLLYRLNTVTMYVPPLRRRRVDIPFLAQHFAEEFGAEHARRITLDENFVDMLTRHDFPGNVRELRNAVERAIALTQPGEPVNTRHLPDDIAAATLDRVTVPRSGSLRSRVESVEREAIREALRRLDGNRTHTAVELGLSRHGLRQKMRRLGLE